MFYFNIDERKENFNQKKENSKAVSSQELLESALELVRRGFRVVALKEREKLPLVKWRRFVDEPVTEGLVREWWSKSPRANLGVVCTFVDEKKQLIVFDFDRPRPELKPLFERVERKGWTVKTGRGFHLWLLVETDRPVRTQKAYPDVDLKGYGGYVVAPPSVHPSGTVYEWVVGPGERELEPVSQEELFELLEKLRNLRRRRRETNRAVERIVQLFEDVYEEGTRNFIVLYLSGWLRKIGVEEERAKELIEEVVRAFGDEEEESRLKVCLRHYSQELEAEKLKGKSGLFDVFSSALGETEAEKRLKELEEILLRLAGKKLRSRKKSSKRKREGGEKSLLGEKLKSWKEGDYLVFGNDVFVIVRRGELLHIEAKKKRIHFVRFNEGAAKEFEQDSEGWKEFLEESAKRDGKDPKSIDVDEWQDYWRDWEEKHRDLIFEWDARFLSGLPKMLRLVQDPIADREEVYELEVETKRGVYRFGPTEIPKLLHEVVRAGLVAASDRSERTIRAFHALLTFLEQIGAFELKSEASRPGFYLIDKKLTSVGFETEVKKEELKEAVEALEWYRKCFYRVEDKFALVMAWAAVAPFSFCLRQKGQRIWVPHLLLVGATRSGKTTLGQIALSLWGDRGQEVPGTSADTLARLGYILSRSTFPTLVNEPRGLWKKDLLIEMLKAATEMTRARGRFYDDRFADIPALSLMILASNGRPPETDPALLERFAILEFLSSEAPKPEERYEFEERHPILKEKLNAIGKGIWKKISRNPERLFKMKDWRDLGIELWRELYQEVGLTNEWIKKAREINYRNFHSEFVEENKELLRAWLYERIFQAAAQRFSRNETAALDAKSVIRKVVEDGSLPWLRFQPRVARVAIMSPMLSELKEKKPELFEAYPTLRQLAISLGWEYKRTAPDGFRGSRVWVVSVPLSEFLDFLVPRLEEEEEEQVPSDDTKKEKIEDVNEVLKELRDEKVSEGEIVGQVVKVSSTWISIDTGDMIETLPVLEGVSTEEVEEGSYVAAVLDEKAFVKELRVLKLPA